MIGSGHQPVGEANCDYSELNTFLATKQKIGGTFDEFIIFVNQDINDFNQRETQEAWADLRNIIAFCAIAIGSCISLFLIVSKRINDSIVQVSRSLHHSASAGALSAQAIRASSHTLAEGATCQAASLEEVSSGPKELASMTKSNLDAVTQSTTVAQHANTSVNDISAELGHLRTAMVRYRTVQ